MTTTARDPIYAGYRYPAEIISYAVWLYFRFPLSLRMVEEMLAARGAACTVSAIGLIIAGLTIGSWWAVVGLSIAAFGFYGSKGPFWSMPPMFLTGTAAAASIAWINSLGNLGGFFGPWYVGVIKDWTGSYAGGLYGLAFLCVMSAVVCALFLHIPNPTVTRGRTAALAAE